MNTGMENTLSVATAVSNTGDGGILPLQILGMVLGVTGLVFFWEPRWALSLSDFYTRMHAAGKGGYFINHVDAYRFCLGYDAGLLAYQLSNRTENSFGGSFYLLNQPDQFPCVDAGCL